MATAHAKRTAKPPGNLSPLEFLAIAIVGKESKTWRDQVPANDEAQEVDFIVWIKGAINVAESQTTTVRSKPDVEELLARVLNALGPKTRETVIEALLTARTAKRPVAIAPDAAETAKRTLEVLTVAKTQDRAGNVSGVLTVVKAKR